MTSDEYDFTPAAYTPTDHELEYLRESLGEFYNDRWFTDILLKVKGGKEATVYCCAAHPSTGLKYVAAKVYRPRMFRAMKNDAVYRIGGTPPAPDGEIAVRAQALRARRRDTAGGQR